MTARRRLLAVLATVLVVAATVLAGGVGPADGRGAFPPERTTRVLVLGDSVIKGTDPYLPGALAGREVTLDAEVSRTTGATADAAAGYGTDWDVVVILVAFNDGGSAGVYQPAYRRMLDQFAGVDRIVLLTLHEVRPYYAGVNAFLRDQAAPRPNVRVADWNAVVQANPGCLSGDGLHPNSTGAQLLAGLVGEQVGQAEFDHKLAFLAAAKLRSDATSTTTSTTTTAPPTTTTLPPTTTTAEVELAPPVSIDREPTTTTEAAAAGSSGGGGSSGGDDGGLPSALAWALPVGLVLGAASILLARRRRTETGPASSATDTAPEAG